ncbi:MAG: hypothetical protein Fur005_32570 [Roseiflexaceae bacterium]
MHTWLLTTETPAEFAGGIARYVDTYAKTATSHGQQVTIIARSDQAGSDQLAPGIRMIRVVPRFGIAADRPTKRPDDHPSFPYNLLDGWSAISYDMAETVIDLLRHEPPPDIIEAQEYAALPAYLLQRKLTERGPLEQIPILIHLHTPLYEVMRVNQEPRYRFPDYWTGQQEQFCIRAADALLSPSHFLADHLSQTLQLATPITRIPYPMLLPDLPPPHPTPGEVVYVGRLEVRKGILPLLEACERMWHRGATFRLTLIGGDTDFRPRGTTMRTFIERRYQQWLAAGVLQMPGRMNQAAVLEHIQRAWVVVIPSLWENFPNTCIEAMGAGQVVLASRSGGQAEMIAADGENGLLFDWQQPGSFEAQLSHALALSPREQRATGQRAQQRIRAMCDPATIIPQRVAHLEQVIEQHQQRRIFPGGLEAQLPALPGAPDPQEQPGLLSVVIPYYNLGAYVEATIASILAAEYRPLEAIIVDDGSSDPESIAEADRLAARHPEVRVVRVANGGLASARNVGAEAATGQYLAFLDADDTVEPEYYRRAIDVLQRYENVAFVYSWVRWFEGTNGIWPTWNAEFPYLLGHNMLAAFVVMPRQRFLQAARNKPEVAYSLEDFEAWITLVEAGGIGVSLPHPLVNYRIRAGSMFRSGVRDQHLYLFDLITQLHPEAYRRWGVELFNLQNANGPARLWNHPAMRADLFEDQLEQLRSELIGGVWVSDMQRGGRVVARMRSSWLARMLRKYRITSFVRQLFGIRR